MGIHALYSPQRPVDATRRLHRQWISLVSRRPSFQYLSITHAHNSYRSYQGYNYDPAYTSHAHGWSSGPTSALSFYVLGLQVTSPQGRTWSLAPHTSGLTCAEGGYETPLGWFGVDWASKDGWFSLTIDTPAGTSGSVRLPYSGGTTVNGVEAHVDSSGTLQLSGGSHTISVRVAA